MSHWRRVRLAIEMFVLYILAPILVYYVVYVRHIPLLTLLPYVLVILIVLLFLEPNRIWLKTFYSRPKIRDVLFILGLFILSGGALTLYTSQVFPELFLAFPRRTPDLWLKVMVFYPLISVTTQEVFYRVFYFHRYAPLFGSFTWGAITMNAVLFAFMHATLFAYRHASFHWQAVLISFVGGLIFAYRFNHTRSFWAVAVEHALYGDLIFTIGLGVFFFTGVANL